MPTDADKGYHDEVLARIPSGDQTEHHVRLRTHDDPMIPPMFDLVLFNTTGGGYSLGCWIPADPAVLEGLAAAFLDARRRLCSS